jgi:MerR family transcriptional regulator, light-induced transcriptional regulator
MDKRKAGMVDEKVFALYLEALLKGNRSQCGQLVDRLLEADIDIKDLYTGLFQDSLYRVGELWENNTISVATEHVATAITEGLLSRLYPRIFAAEHCGKKAVISCVANEWHQIGGKMVADIFELNGWDTDFIGANTPVDDLVRHIDLVSPDVLGLSLSLYSNMEVLLQTIATIRSHFRELHIFCGGQAFRWGGLEKLRQITGTEYIPSLHVLEQTLVN